VSIDGQSLPVPERSDSTRTIIAGNATLFGADSARFQQTVVSAGSQLTEFQTGYYAVQQRSDTLVFVPQYLANAIDTGLVRSDSLIVRAHIRAASEFVPEVHVYRRSATRQP
jgi:hypothetical protein